MKKTSKRIISLLLALIMVAGVVAIGLTVNAANEEYPYDIGDDIQHEIRRVTDEGFEVVGNEGHIYEEDENGKFICMSCGHELGTQDPSPHEGFVEKKSNIAGTCEGFPYDIYRCRHCGNEYQVKTGPELGHYWPIKLDSNNENPVYEKDDDTGELIQDKWRDEGGNEIDGTEHYWNVPYGEADRYVSYTYNESNESCTITLKCVRCEEPITYTVYTRSNDIGMIVNKVVNEPAADCGPKTVQKWAEFKIQNTSNSFGVDYFYFHHAVGEEETIESETPHTWGNWIPDSQDPGKHVRTCSECGTSQTAECRFSNWADNGENHARTCSICGYQETENHNFGRFVSNNDGTHTAKCSVCQATDTQNCTSYVYPEHNVAGHKKVCADCGYVVATSEAHDFGAFTDNGDGTHSKTCTLCGQTGEVAEHNPSSYVQAGADGHRAICEDCGAAYLEAHEEDEPVTNVTVAPTCTEEGKQDVTVYCKKCHYKMSEQKDQAVPALGHDWGADGVCTVCGESYACGVDGHKPDPDVEIEANDLLHYKACLYCHRPIYNGIDGKWYSITITTDENGATTVSPETARHDYQDLYIDNEADLANHKYCSTCGTLHEHNFVKTGTITGSCETYSYDIYKCVTCEHKVNVRKGNQLGHYWPIELEDDGVTPKVENGSVVYDEDYVSFRWGAKNESCTITITCKRPECGKTASYTIYTKKTDFGMITKKKTCLGTKYIATFTNLPDIPTGSDGTYVLTTTASVETGSGSHTPGKVLEKVDPTCTEAGYTRYECKKCGEDFKVTTPATGHDYQMKTDATGKTWYECSKCGASYTVTPCRDGQHVDEDFDFVCERCHSKISFRENWPHYIVGLPMYWIRKAISWLLDGRQGILKF